MKSSKLVIPIISLFIATTALGQKINYGNNPSAGHYFDAGDAKLYYEIYGQGEVLLHGGVYGYIDEFEPFIERLAGNYQLICIATRGHGKSEIGRTQYSFEQRATDAYKIIRSITKDSVTVMGFSDGGFASLKLAALYPELVKKLIVIGAGDLPQMTSGEHRYEQYTPEGLMTQAAAFFESRLRFMPEPQRWGESLDMLNKMYNKDFVSMETFSKIKCPTLIMAGDRDEYAPVEDFVKCKNAIANAQLAIIPGCGHVVFYCNFAVVWDCIEPFLEK